MANEGDRELLKLKCSLCNEKEQTMKRCTRCREVFYCSRSCQVKDWPHHKMECQLLASKSVIEGSVIMKTNNYHSLFDKDKKRSTTKESEGDIKSSYQERKVEITQIVEQDQISCSIMTPHDQKLSESQQGKWQQDEPDSNDTHTNGEGSAVNIENTVCGENKEKLVKTLEGSGTSITVVHTLPNCRCFKIYVKHNHQKHQFQVTHTDAFQQISDFLHIPVSKLKLIYKGKVINMANISEVLGERALFLAIGEVAESEEGLEKGDIQIIMHQLNVERNIAIKALRKTGTLVDAIFEIGNNS